MPLKRCQRDKQPGWKWGDKGKCYIASEEGSDDAAKQKALLQGIAIGDTEEVRNYLERNGK